jgi:peptide deformylase
MALMNILQFPDPRLKNVAKEIDVFDQDLVRLVKDMLETMYEAQGVGLAATQVNVPKRVFVLDVSDERNQPLCLINPVITNKRGVVNCEEGCLSFPGAYATVKRAKEVDVSFYDHLGKIQQLSATDLFANCIQHELDHLNGVTFYDHLSPLKQSLLRKKLDKRRKAL